MVQFNKLRLSGFKSFVEQTELAIDPGMTGIVGPNGCGKSNLVEALRWVMGETSAKKMRGGEMDDVIFGGTEQRPSRNLAEVGLVLDNKTRTATAEYNSADELEVVRRIERGEGSDYRINGRNVRQKDVQLLFADQATGAHSTSIVSQGQVGAIVNSKPSERRQILEEAAGITGLHARRHEAELRLKGAESNMTRVEDMMQNMTTQMNALQRQARQASKYRTLSEQIRETEAALLHVKWLGAQSDHAESEAALANAERQVRDLTLLVTRGNTERAEMAATLPPLRQEEAAAAAILQRLIITRETLDSDLARTSAALEQQRRLFDQTLADSAREQALSADAESALERLTEESAQLQREREEAAETLPAAESELASQNELLRTLETKVAELTRELATVTAERQSLTSQIAQLEGRVTTLSGRRSDTLAQLESLNIDTETRAALDSAKAAVASAEAILTARQDAAATVENTLKEAETQASTARESKLAEQAALNKCEAEAAALIQILASGDDMYAPLVDQVTAEAGFEVALAAALGEALSAPLDSEATMYWQNLPEYSGSTSLPGGVEAIGKYIKAPAALSRALSQIGVVPDTATGQRLAVQLQPGQVLVSRAGDAWRWDGYTVKADAPTAAAIKLKQKNRLVELKVEIGERQPKLAAATAELEAAQTSVASTTDEARAARDALQQAYQGLTAARADETRLMQAHAATASRLEALNTTLSAINDDLARAEGDLHDAQTRRADLADDTVLTRQVATAQEELGETRAQQAEWQSKVTTIRADIAGYDRRTLTMNNERESWQSRMSSAGARQEELTARKAQAEAEIQRLESRPVEIEEERRALLGQLSEAENTRQKASDTLVEAENKLTMHERTLKQQEESLTVSREDRVRAEGALEAAQHSQQELLARMQEKLDATPDQLLAIAKIVANENGELPELPASDLLERNLAKHVSDRDALGPVNLRADVEAEELNKEVSRVNTERDELAEAIAKLRQGIQELNKEARTRLTEAFEQVNAHFQDLFVRLFGGGRAYLQLTEAEDALDAGLEIYASPPGKKLQILSLLSGGEKALTATALLFAVFICNPSPICVLDEVDAPLDESNVGRFCDMVEEIARTKKTRFLIVTHHRLTMARMDRLYGVTMQERGVSSLMSVDLATAERYRETGSSAPAPDSKAA